MNNVSNAGGVSRWNLMLVGAGMRILHWDAPLSVPGIWVHFEAHLDASNWTMVVDSNNWEGEVTQSDLLAVLTDLEGTYVLGDWGLGSDTDMAGQCSNVSSPNPRCIMAAWFGHHRSCGPQSQNEVSCLQP
jgi:hypothetical protein